MEPSKLYSHVLTCCVGPSRRSESARMRRFGPTLRRMQPLALQTHHLATPYCNSKPGDMSSRCGPKDSLSQSARRHDMTCHPVAHGRPVFFNTFNDLVTWQAPL